MEELIRQLTQAFGPSGEEGPIRDVIQGMISDCVDELRVDSMGNLIALRRAKGQGSAGRLMLAAHMDEVGIIVSYIDEKGFARFHNVGGLRPLGLLGSRVVFASGVVGVIGSEKDFDKSSTIDKLFIDTGARSREECPLRIGELGAFDRPFVSQNDRWMAKALDDRVGCAVLVQLLRDLGETAYDLSVVFTTQEELGLRGATVSAFGLEPQLAVAVDVTGAGDTPESPKVPMQLGEGAAIKVKDGGMITHSGLRRHLIHLAESAGIPYQMEVLGAGSTDARAIQTTRDGVPAAVISVPCRYIHTPSELVDAGDVRATLALLTELIRQPAPIS